MRELDYTINSESLIDVALVVKSLALGGKIYRPQDCWFVFIYRILREKSRKNVSVYLFNHNLYGYIFYPGTKITNYDPKTFQIYRKDPNGEK